MRARRRLTVDRVLDRRQPDLTLLAENLHKPRNFSAVIRSADAVGIHEVNVVAGDGQPRRHWHTSSGTEKWVRLRLHRDIDAACIDLKGRGFRLVAAHLSDGARDFRQVDYTRPTALLFGTELFGVSDAALEHADECARIPMEGMTQSLNVSVACALLLYEAQRQRAAAGMYDACRLDPATRAALRFEWLHPKLAAFCRQRDLDYPELDEAGELLGELPRG